MFGCTVDGGLNPIVKGTKGIKQLAVRTDIGVVELTLDTPMAPNEYSVSGCVTEPVDPGANFVPTKMLVSGVAKIEVRTFSAGVPADLDFDVSVFRYIDINNQ